MPENLSWLQNIHIEAIVFDLGKVIIPVDFDRTVQAFVTLGGNQASELYHYKGQTNLFEELERGEVSRKEFLSRLRPELSYASDAEIVDGWNAMLYHVDCSTFEYLNKLRPRFRTFILSNINTYHAEWVDKAMRSTDSEHAIYQYFDHVFYSHEIGHRKPEYGAWQYIIEQEGIHAQQTLFIDDKKENIEAAKALGFIGLLWNPSWDIRSVVDILLPS
tara:strand:+ start:1423 stop:2076 length:654 start_codon:yes stop_codon:yes gene_type:complete